MSAVSHAIEALDICLDRVELLAMASTSEVNIAPSAKAALLQGALDLEEALQSIRDALSASLDGSNEGKDEVDPPLPKSAEASSTTRLTRIMAFQGEQIEALENAISESRMQGQIVGALVEERLFLDPGDRFNATLTRDDVDVIAFAVTRLCGMHDRLRGVFQTASIDRVVAE